MRRIACGLLAAGCGLLCGCHVHLHYHPPARAPDALTQSLEDLTDDHTNTGQENDLGWPDLDR